MNLFTGTAQYYRKYRPGIPAEVATVLHEATRTGTPRRLLDIGTGTGLVAEALLDHFDDIIAIDNDADMLKAAEAALRPALPEGSSLLLVESTAEGFTPPTGWQADLVTICRAFHWLDQPAVLALLDDQVAPDGAVATTASGSPGTPGSKPSEPSSRTSSASSAAPGAGPLPTTTAPTARL